MTKSLPTQTEHLTTPAYRRDIDGLRAIAVLSVVGYHASPYWIRGGFVGVDVFFVISGFLISTIIMGGVDRGDFSFLEFYTRRVKRIFPALALVMAASLAFGWFTLLSDEFQALGKDVAAGAGFMSNFVLWNESGYFDAAAELKPLLHLWSLGIEEQFYIVWPLLLYLAWKKRFNLLSLTLLLVAISFFLNVGTVRKDAVGTFYSPATRIWELLLGSALAYLTLFRKGLFERLRARLDGMLGRIVYSEAPEQDGSTLRDTKAMIGFLLILGMVFGFTKSHTFPGWWAVIPTVGAVLLISAGPKAWVNRTILSNRVLVFFGLISFPLYLWHWPLLSFAQIIVGGMPSRSVRIAAVLISIVLAWLTYAILEKRIRFGKYGHVKALILCCLLSGAALVGGLAWRGKIGPYSQKFGLEKIVKAHGEWAFPGENLKPFEFEGQTFYLRQSNHDTKTLYLGDSNMQQYGPRIDYLVGKDPGGTRSAVFAALGNCPPIRDVHDSKNPDCSRLVEKAIKYAKRPDVDKVVIGAQWFGYFASAPGRWYYEEAGTRSEFGQKAKGSEKAYRSLEATLTELKGAGKAVYLIGNIPISEDVDPSTMVRRSLFPIGFIVNKAGIKKSWLLEHYGGVRQRLMDVGARSGAIVIDPLNFLCSENVCPSVGEEGQAIYMDSVHLRPTYVREKVRYLDETIEVN